MQSTDDSFSHPAGSAGSGAHQGTTDSSDYQIALQIHIQLAFNNKPQILFHGAALQLLILQSVCISRVALSQVQNLVLDLVKLHDIVLGH